jgi:phosphate transport system protein
VNSLKSSLSGRPELLPSYLDLIFVARALERIGDHATNIAEDSFWRDQAADIRHTYGTKERILINQYQYLL